MATNTAIADRLLELIAMDIHKIDIQPKKSLEPIVFDRVNIFKLQKTKKRNSAVVLAELSPGKVKL